MQMKQPQKAAIATFLIVIALMMAGCGRGEEASTLEATSESTEMPTDAPSVEPTDTPVPNSVLEEQKTVAADQNESPLRMPEQPASPLDSPLPTPQAPPAEIEAILAVGAALLAEGEYEQAHALYTEAIAANPDQPLLFEERGDIYLDLHQNLAAIEDYSQALAFGQTSELLAKRCLAGIYVRRDGTVEDCNRAREIDPANIDAYLALAEFYYDQQDYASARANLESAQDLAETGRAIFLLGKVDFGEKKWDEGLEHISRAIELDPQPDYYWDRGMFYLGIGETEKSLADFEALREVGHPNIHGGLLFRAASQIRMLTGEYPSD